MQKIFYSSGLRFECTRCSRCCRHTPGYVFLSPADLGRLAAAFALPRGEFLRTYCRDVDLGLARRVSLKEKPNLDCILWENGGCSVYEARPLQCRSFPFWSACVASEQEWLLQAKNCPGMGQGTVHSRKEIEGWLSLRASEGFLES
jgi:Fe-S-cluster containining protein